MSSQTAPATRSNLNPQLNSCITYDPHSNYASNNRWSKLWTVAAIITFLSYTAFAVFVNIYFYSEALNLLFGVNICLICGGLPLSFKAFEYMWNKASNYAQLRQLDSMLIEKIGEIKQKVPQAAWNLGITSAKKDANSVDLSSALAFYQIYEEKYHSMLEEAEKLKVDASSNTSFPWPVGKEIFPIYTSTSRLTVEKTNLKNGQLTEAFKTLQKLRIAKSNLFQDAAIGKLKAIELLYIACNPYKNDEAADFFRLHDVKYVKRLIAEDHGDKSARVLVSKGDQTYTAEDIINADEVNLMQQLFV